MTDAPTWANDTPIPSAPRSRDVEHFTGEIANREQRALDKVGADRIEQAHARAQAALAYMFDVANDCTASESTVRAGSERLVEKVAELQGLIADLVTDNDELGLEVDGLGQLVRELEGTNARLEGEIARLQGVVAAAGGKS